MLTENAEKKSGYNPMVPAVEQAAKLLFQLAHHRNRDMNLTQICQALDIHKSKGYALLHTLGHFKLVTRHADTKTYSLGPGLLSLAQHAQENQDIGKHALPFLQKLAADTKCTVLLGVIVNDRFHIINKIESNNPINISVRQFQTLHITHGAHGKAIAAFSPPEEQKRLFSLDPIEFYGQGRTVDFSLLEKEMADCLETGYAVDNGQSSPGISALSSPTFNHENKIIGAIVLLGTFTSAAVKDLGKQVTLTAQQISIEFGADPNVSASHLKG